MIANSLVTQIITAVISLAIIITYIKPTFESIGSIQALTESYAKEIANVGTVNTTLDEQIKKINAMPLVSRNALDVFLPKTLDEVSVMRDINILARRTDIVLDNIVYSSYADNKAVSVEGDQVIETTLEPIKHSFEISFTSSYSQLKQFLLLVERNNYPLEIDTLSINPTEGGLMGISIVLATYSHK